jgi:hypothetical protein
MKSAPNSQSWLEPLHAWRLFRTHQLNERSAVDSLLFPVKLEA